MGSISSTERNISSTLKFGVDKCEMSGLSTSLGTENLRQYVATANDLLGPLRYRAFPISEDNSVVISRTNDGVLVVRRIRQELIDGKTPYSSLNYEHYFDGKSTREGIKELEGALKAAKEMRGAAAKISRILVTGSCGTIGAQTCAALLQKGYTVIGLDTRDYAHHPRALEITRHCDLEVNGSLSSALAGEKAPDLILHLAAHPLVRESVINPELQDRNEAMTRQVVKYARDNKIQVIGASSREVYGDQGDRVEPFHEDLPLLGGAESPYAASKAHLETNLGVLTHAYNVPTAVIRYSNVIGPEFRYRFGPICVELAREGATITVFGGTKAYDFTHLEDAVNGTVALIDAALCPHAQNTFNIAAGRAVPIKSFASQIVAIMNSASKINTSTNRPGEIDKYVADLTRIHKAVGYTPQHIEIEKIAGEFVCWQEMLRQSSDSKQAGAYQRLQSEIQVKHIKT